MADMNTERLAQAVKTTHELRTSVQQVFDRLSQGMSDTTKPPDKEKVFLAELQQKLLVVNRDLSEIEKLSSSIVTPTGPLSLGNSGMLSLDPGPEKTILYSQLHQAYRWFNKVHEQATYAASLLSQNSLKRSSHAPTMHGGKRAKRTQATGHALPNQVVDAVVQNMDRLFPDMSIQLHRPLGNPAVLQISLGRILRAIVVLRGLVIEHVLVKAFKEDLHSENGKLDMWSKSRYRLFQKVTEHTSAAMLHFYLPYIPELAVKSFLTWLHSYTTLFSSPCHKCGKHLHDSLPPTWRDLRTLDAYHETCRP